MRLWVQSIICTYSSVYFSVRGTKVFDTFRNSLILLNINKHNEYNYKLFYLPYQGNPLIRQFIIFTKKKVFFYKNKIFILLKLDSFIR